MALWAERAGRPVFPLPGPWEGRKSQEGSWCSGERGKLFPDQFFPAPTHFLVVPATAVTLSRPLLSGAQELKGNSLEVEVRKAREPQAHSSLTPLTSHSSHSSCVAFSALVAA